MMPIKPAPPDPYVSPRPGEFAPEEHLQPSLTIRHLPRLPERTPRCPSRTTGLASPGG
jgi:hypothetical protein